MAPLTPCQLGFVLSTPAPCSCYGCGNPRNWFKERTIQEQRAMQVDVTDLLEDSALDEEVEATAL